MVNLALSSFVTVNTNDNSNDVTKNLICISDSGASRDFSPSSQHLIDYKRVKGATLHGVDSDNPIPIEGFGFRRGLYQTQYQNVFIEFWSVVGVVPQLSVHLIGRNAWTIESPACQWVINEEYDNFYAEHKWARYKEKVLRVPMHLSAQGLAEVICYIPSNLSTSAMIVYGGGPPSLPRTVFNTYCCFNGRAVTRSSVRRNQPTMTGVPTPGAIAIITGALWDNNESNLYEEGIIMGPSTKKVKDDGYNNGQRLWEILFDNDELYDVCEHSITYTRQEADKVKGDYLSWIRRGRPNLFDASLVEIDPKKNFKTAKRKHETDSNLSLPKKSKVATPAVNSVISLLERSPLIYDIDPTIVVSPSLSAPIVPSEVVDTSVITPLSEGLSLPLLNSNPIVASNGEKKNRPERMRASDFFQEARADSLPVTKRKHGVRISHDDYHIMTGHLERTSLMHNAKLNQVELTGAPVINCKTCRPFKAQSKQVPSSTEHVYSKLEEVQVDFAKLMPAYNRDRYLMAIVDVGTGKAFVNSIKDRTGREMHAKLKEFTTRWSGRGRGGYILKRVHSDGEKGLKSKLVERYFLKKKVRHIVDPPHTPEWRAIVERRIARVKKVTAILLHQAGFKTMELKRYWTFAAKCAARIINNTVSQLDDKTPNEKFGEDVVPLWLLPQFGSLASVYKHGTNEISKTTFDTTATEMVFLDFDDQASASGDHKVAYFLNPDSMEIIRSKSFKIYNGEYFEFPFQDDDINHDDLSVTSSDYETPDDDNQSVNSMDTDNTVGSRASTTNSDTESVSSADEAFIGMKCKVTTDTDSVVSSGRVATDSMLGLMSAGSRATTTESYTVSDNSADEAFISMFAQKQGELMVEVPSEGNLHPCQSIYSMSTNCSDQAKRDKILKAYSCVANTFEWNDVVKSVVNSLLNIDAPESLTSELETASHKVSMTNDPGIDLSLPDGCLSMKNVEMGNIATGRPDIDTSLSEGCFSIDGAGKVGNTSSASVKPTHNGLLGGGTYDELKRCTDIDKPSKAESILHGLDLSGSANITIVNTETHKSYFLKEIFQNVLSFTAKMGCGMVPKGVPSSLGEINAHPDRDMIWAAVMKELKSLIDNETWEIVPRPKERTVIKSKWILTVKLDVHGDIERYKARFVARGFSQILGLDYNETYAPVVSTVTLRIVLSMMAAKGWSMSQLDVETAFLNSKLDEEIYVELPEMWEELMKDTSHPRKDWVLLMRRALYGLKQAPYLWNKLITQVLRTIGLEPSPLDDCLFVAKNEKGQIAIVCLYVDDLVITGNWTEKMDEVKETLSTTFSMRDVTGKCLLLGMTYNYSQKERKIEIHQAPYVKKIIERFEPLFVGGLERGASTPANTTAYKEVFDAMESGNDTKIDFPYREAIGSVLYLVVMTRPDIANIVRFLSRFVTCYTSIHVKMLGRVFSYVKETPKLGLCYSAVASHTGELIAYSDASFNDDKSTARSTNAFLIMLNGNAVAWKSTLMNFVVQSSTHSEYGAMSEATFSANHCRGILDWVMGTKQEKPVNVKCKEQNAVDSIESACKDINGVRLNVDNLAAIHIATHDLHSKRSKHINLRFMNVRDAVLRNEIVIEWVKTDNQLADLLTKCLSAGPFNKLKNAVMTACR
jgi:hypothetical protein